MKRETEPTHHRRCGISRVADEIDESRIRQIPVQRGYFGGERWVFRQEDPASSARVEVTFHTSHVESDNGVPQPGLRVSIEVGKRFGGAFVGKEKPTEKTEPEQPKPVEEAKPAEKKDETKDKKEGK